MWARRRRFPTASTLDPDWLRQWARGLRWQKDILSPYRLIDLPTPADAAAAVSVDAVARLPTGVRIRFLASGAELVARDEEERMRGDFDGALDFVVEEGRVRVVRAEFEPQWRRLTNGARRQVVPIVKVTSEARLLARLQQDLEDLGELVL